MSVFRTMRHAAHIALAVALPVAIGCGENGVEPPPGLVGTWDATAIVVDGIDLIDEGMTLSYTFTSGGEYSYVVTGDLLDYCDPGPNCSDGGDIEATASQITFDPGTIDEETFSYSIVGTTLTVSATIDGSTFAFTFEKR